MIDTGNIQKYKENYEVPQCHIYNRKVYYSNIKNQVLGNKNCFFKYLHEMTQSIVASAYFIATLLFLLHIT